MSIVIVLEQRARCGSEEELSFIRPFEEMPGRWR
jgi:hypothetical protein